MDRRATLARAHATQRTGIIRLCPIRVNVRSAYCAGRREIGQGRLLT